MSGIQGDRVLVTGALGQLGTDLVQALRRQHGKDSVIASDIRESDGHSSIEEGPYMPLDVMDTDAISGICKREGIGTVYHLAALLSATGERNPDKCRRINVGGESFFNGLIDDPRIYNRALSASEVMQLYKLGARE